MSMCNGTIGATQNIFGLGHLKALNRLWPDLLLAFLNSLTFPLSCLINYTGFRSQLVSSLKLLLWFLVPNWVLLQLSSGSHSLSFICNFPSTTPLFRSAGSFCSRIRTTMAQTSSFATIGPSLWNAIPSFLRLTLLSGSLSTSLPFLKTYFYYRDLRTGSATEWSLP